MRAPIRKTLVMAAVIALAGAPIAPAVARDHGYGHGRSWGVGRDVVGAVVALVTLPLVIASAALGADERAEGYPPPGDYDGGARGYAPPPAYYPPPVAYAPPAYYEARPPVYVAPPAAYYRPSERYYPSPGYYSRPRSGSYAPPRGYYYAPHSRYPGSYGDHGRDENYGYRRR